MAMDRVKAQERLEDFDYTSRLSMEGYYNLLIRAGFPPEEAHKAALQRGWDRLAAGEML